MELEPGCCSGDPRLSLSVSLPPRRPASGVSATMIQNVGNHLRRVCRVGWGWMGGKGEGTAGWESQKRIEVSILSQKFYISSLIFHGPFSNSLLEGEIAGPLGWFIISSNPQTSPRGH